MGFLVATVSWLAPAVADGAEPEALLKTLQERRNQVKSLHTVTETIVHQKELTRKTRFEYWERKGDKTWKTRRVGRTESNAKGSKGPQVADSLTVSDGQSEWSELPGAGTKIVIKSAAIREDDYDRVFASMKRGKARTKPGEKVQGLETIVIEIVSGGHASPFKATYWVSERHGVILRSRVRNADGSSLEMETTLCEVNATIPDEKFIYTAPEGVKVIDTTGIGRGDNAKKKP